MSEKPGDHHDKEAGVLSPVSIKSIVVWFDTAFEIDVAPIRRFEIVTQIDVADVACAKGGR